jgi:streptomycin 6-kinase
MDVPANLRWMHDNPDTRAWLATVPGRLQRAAERWELAMGPVFAGAHVSYTCPATTTDGTDVVLKLQYPHEDCRCEAETLRAWDGRGAVRLLAHDADDSALLLERANPGTHISSTDPSAAIDVMADLTERSWVTPGPDCTMAALVDHGRHWMLDIEAGWQHHGRPCPRSLIDLAIECLRDVVEDQGEQVIVNQDLHGDNVIAAEREPWLIIDPKPLIGEREFSVSPIVRSNELGHSEAAVVGRLDRLCDRLALDRHRAVRWTIGQTVCWALAEGSVLRPPHLESAAWLGRLVGPEPRVR